MNVGIDFGTTNTVVAYEQNGTIEYLEFDEEDFAMNRLPKYVLPSAVYLPNESKKVLVGQKAFEKRFCLKDGKYIASVKRNIDSEKNVFDEDEEQYNSQQISEFILRKAYRQLKKAFPEETEFCATVAVPVESDGKIPATLETVKQAGFVLAKKNTISEPIAAAIACRASAEDKLEGAKSILVIDMGGGTLDICSVEICNVLDVNRKETTVARHLGGDGRLGGDDFDEIVSDILLAKLSRMFNMEFQYEEDTYEHIKCEGRRIKEKLQYREAATLDAEYVAEITGKMCSNRENIRITREEYYSKAEELIDKVKKVIFSAVKNKNITFDKILLVGGMSAEPFLKEFIFEEFGKDNIVWFRPSSKELMGFIAKGAAIVNQNTNLIVCNYNQSSIGVVLKDGSVDVIFEANTELNHKQVKKIYTPADANTMQLRLPLVEYMGEYQENKGKALTELIVMLPAGTAKEQEVEVCFEIDDERRIRIHANAVNDKSKQYNCEIVF